MDNDADKKFGLEIGRTVNNLDDIEDLKARLVEQADLIAKLQCHEELHRNILETTNAVAWEVDAKSLQFTYMSPQIEALSGYAPEKWVDFEFWASKIHPDERLEAVDWCTAETAKGLDHVIEYRMLQADGSTVWVRDVITVISENEVPTFLRGHFFNIDDRKKAEERSLALQATTYRSQKMESLGQMAGGIAHDFNNLLTVILGNTELMLIASDMDVPNTPFATAPLLEDIHKAGNQAAGLIREMLTYAGKDPLELTDVQLNALILDMWRLLERAHPKNVNLTHDLGNNLLTISADPTLLQQVILNLIINASDAVGTKAGSICVRTRLVNTRQIEFDESFTNLLPNVQNCVVLEVSDTGSGIEDDIFAKLFEPFFSTKMTGRGLGLAIVQGLVNRHSGTISIKSKSGFGTTFSLYFPALEKTHPKAIEKETKNAQIPLSKGLILVVDDEDGVRDMADRILAFSGFSTLCASNGFEAIELFKQRQDEIDCVLLDLRMPLINGEETLEQLRLIDEQVKVVLVSGNFDPDEATKLKVSRFVQKPYSMEDLTRALSDAISGTVLSDT